MSNQREFRTMFSSQALALADRFKLRMALVKISPGDYTAELTAPDGPSTGGGVQALQHIRLVSRQQGRPPILVGSANPKEGTAELRSFDHVSAVHARRFKEPLVLDQASYDTFLREASAFLTESHMKTLVLGPPAEVTPSIRPPSSAAATGGSRAGLWMGLILLAAGLIGGAVWFFVLRK